LPNGTDEPITPLGYRFDVLGILSEGSAQYENAVGKIALLDKRVRPECPDKFFFLQ
jgi:hypothetical protein